MRLLSWPGKALFIKNCWIEIDLNQALASAEYEEGEWFPLSDFLFLRRNEFLWKDYLWVWPGGRKS